MKRSRIFTVAAVLSVVACTDNPNAILTGPIDPSQPILPSPSTATIAGRISVSGIGADRVVELTDADGGVYRLVGNESRALASVDGGDVVARGTFDANPGFVVDEFTVTGMHGRPALDGVLEASEDGFALRLSDGSVRVVPGLSSDCAEHVGARMWVIGWDESEVVFGLIEAL
ncbi:MAG TPA: hypothetical protein VIK50_00085 [Gemmatimonadaceae bacterium]